MLTLHTEALVLRAVDFGESDRIVHLLTPALGRLPAIAKGARRSRRRFPGTLDLFNQLGVQLVRSRPAALARLEGARLLRTFESIRLGAARFALGCYLLELLDRLAPEGGAPRDLARLFAFARGALDWLEREPPTSRMRVLLELRALDALGLRPELLRCVRCGRELAAREPGRPGAAAIPFLIAEGGPLCAACESGAQGAALPIHLGTLRALHRALHLPLDQLGRLALGGAALTEAQRLVTRFLDFHVGVALQSRRILDEELTLPGGEGKLPPLRQGPGGVSGPRGSVPRSEPKASEGQAGSEGS